MAVKALGRWTEKDDKFACVIRFYMDIGKIDWKTIVKKTNIKQSTHFKRLREPESMTIRELREYINTLKIPEDDVLDALYLNRGGKGK